MEAASTSLRPSSGRARPMPERNLSIGDVVVPLRCAALLFALSYAAAWFVFGFRALFLLHSALVLTTFLYNLLPFSTSPFSSSSSIAPQWWDQARLGPALLMAGLSAVLPHWSWLGFAVWGNETFQQRANDLHRALFRRNRDINYYRR